MTDLIDAMTALASARSDVTDFPLFRRRLEILRPLVRLMRNECCYAIPDDVDIANALMAISILTGRDVDLAELSATIFTGSQSHGLPMSCSDYYITLAGIISLYRDTLLLLRQTSSDSTDCCAVSRMVRHCMVDHCSRSSQVFDALLCHGDIWGLVVHANEAAVTAFYLSAVHGDTVGIRRLAPILRLMAQVVPIGIPRAVPTRWFFASPI